MTHLAFGGISSTTQQVYNTQAPDQAPEITIWNAAAQGARSGGADARGSQGTAALLLLLSVLVDRTYRG